METAVTFQRSFFPKIRLKISLNWQVFWLTLLFAAFPLRVTGAVAGIAKSFAKVYSCGHSSGIEPDSLFRLTPENRKLVNQVAAKVENIPE
jgi:hypothetical protein